MIEYPENLEIRRTLLSNALKQKAVMQAALKGAEKFDPKVAADFIVTDAFSNVFAAADGVMSLINQQQLAMDLGVNIDKDDKEQVDARKESDVKKSALVEALSAKAVSFMSLYRLEGVSRSPYINTSSAVAAATSASVAVAAASAIVDAAIDAAVGNVEVAGPEYVEAAATAPVGVPSSTLVEFELVCKQLMKWDDINAEKHWFLCVGRHRAAGRHGSALKRVNELLAACADNKAGKSTSATSDGGGGGGSNYGLTREVLLEEKIQCLDDLGWNHLLVDVKKWALLNASDSSYELF